MCLRVLSLFIQISQKDAESLVKVIMQQIEKVKMKLEDCRSQCYNNTAVMAGHRRSVQQRINEKNSLAVFENKQLILRVMINNW